MSIDTLESILRDLYSDAWTNGQIAGGNEMGAGLDFEETQEEEIIEQAIKALNLYIEGKIKEARIDELEQIRKEFSAKVADPFKEDNWQGNRLRNAQLYKLIDITKDRIKELEK